MLCLVERKKMNEINLRKVILFPSFLVCPFSRSKCSWRLEPSRISPHKAAILMPTPYFQALLSCCPTSKPKFAQPHRVLICVLYLLATRITSPITVSDHAITQLPILFSVTEAEQQHFIFTPRSLRSKQAVALITKPCNYHLRKTNRHDNKRHRKRVILLYIYHI
jgi:hypothetical protein